MNLRERKRGPFRQHPSGASGETMFELWVPNETKQIRFQHGSSDDALGASKEMNLYNSV